MKKSNIKSINKFLSSAYPSSGLFENTDDNNLTEIMLNDGSFVMVLNDNQLRVLREELLTSDVTDGEHIKVNEEINKVSEDFALKAMALTLNKEKYSDLK